MTIFAVPIPNVAQSFRQTVTLDGTAFILQFRWNWRAGSWFLDLYDAAGGLLVAGRRVIVGPPLWLGLHYRPELPLGELVAFDSSGQDQDPGLEDLGRRVQLFYLDKDEGPFS